MYGAIYGDIIGCRFEFDRGGHSKDFTLFTQEDDFTDDTVMTVAVADALLSAGKDADAATIRQLCIEKMQLWGRRYPNAGYGGRFLGWLWQENPLPYNSWGNGSAMRVAAVGWLYDTVERTMEVARATAEVSHDHPEGIKGAVCTAALTFLARTGAAKEEMLAFQQEQFGYDLSETLEHMRARHRHDESCMDTMPKSLKAFFEADSYEDAIRNAVSLGGDTDTIAAITGAIAEAFWGIPIGIHAEGSAYLPADILEVLSRFDTVLGRKSDSSESEYAANCIIRQAVANCRQAQTKEALLNVLQTLNRRMLEHGEAPTPMIDESHVMEALDMDRLCIGDTFRLEQDVRLTFETMQDGNGNLWLPLFTEEAEVNKGECAGIRMNVPIESILRSGLNSERALGVVIDPFGQAMTLPKELLKILFEIREKINHDN